MKGASENHWISLSDIMTGLMIIFMFIAVAYMLEIQKKQAERDIAIKEFKNIKEQLYTELDSTFRDDFDRWNITLDRDLSIKFTNPEVLFHSGQDRIRTEFRRILDEFIPKYLAVILQPKYRDNIVEIRIEGHTDPAPFDNRKKTEEDTSLLPDDPSMIRSDSFIYAQRMKIIERQKRKNKSNEASSSDRTYMSNVELSQNRAREVLAYFRQHEAYRELPNEEKERLQFWFTATGFSYGRTLDKNKKLTFETGEDIDYRNSRRVEFRIVTNSEKLVEKIIQQINQ